MTKLVKDYFRSVLGAIRNPKAKLGSLFVLLVCLNGGLALFYAMLQNRLADQVFLFIATGVIASLGLVFYWFFRPSAVATRKAQMSARVPSDASALHSQKREKNRERRHEKNREKKRKKRH